jgi:glycosyltransferase involved in cell wall biosynthesis
VEDKKYLDENLGLREGQVVAVGGAGVDPQRFPFVAQLPDNPAPAILVPARLLREKGFFEAVEASRILDNRGVSHELRFTGRLDLGNPHGITQAELDQAENTAPSVNVLPFQDDIHAAYAAADIICLPTYYREGLPTTLSEASAVGRAIASTNSIGVRDIITDDVNGLLAEPRAAEPLADVLQRLIEDPALRERLRQEAYTKYLARFTKDHNVTDHAPAYRALGLELDRMQA